MKKSVQFLLNTVGPIATLVVAVLGFKALLAGREAPERERPPDPGMLVEVEAARSIREPIEVTADGVAVASRQLVVQAQVSGRLDSIHESLVVGGLIDAGERIATIEADDYRIAVDEARASVAQAGAQLEIERGRQRVAEREWEIFSESAPDSADSALATREPQVRSAEIQVEIAEARLARARLNRSRTSIEAPFSGLVLRENAELGQLVTAQYQLATIVGTDEFWVEVSVPVDALASIRIPGINAVDGSPVTVLQRSPSGTIERDGRVVRLLGEMSQVGRMARLIVSVEDPLDLQRPLDQRRIPLLLGSYVTVVLEGATLEDVIEVPRTALHDGTNVYVAVDGELSIRQVDIAWRRADSVYVREGIRPGERYVTSPIPIAVDGMKIRVAGDEPPEGDGDA